MQRIAVGIALMILLGATGAVAAEGHVNVILGQVQLADEFFSLEEQSEFGVQVSVGREQWAVGIAVDLLASEGDDTNLGITDDGSTTELNLGLRKIWKRPGKARPFLGGGLAFIEVERERSALGIPFQKDDDGGTGVWLGGGAFWRLGRSFNLGFEARVTRAEVKLFGADTDVGGSHLGLILGWGRQ